jgi:hypothetical protein
VATLPRSDVAALVGESACAFHAQGLRDCLVLWDALTDQLADFLALGWAIFTAVFTFGHFSLLQR